MSNCQTGCFRQNAAPTPIPPLYYSQVCCHAVSILPFHTFVAGLKLRIVRFLFIWSRHFVWTGKLKANRMCVWCVETRGTSVQREFSIRHLIFSFYTEQSPVGNQRASSQRLRFYSCTILAEEFCKIKCTVKLIISNYVISSSDVKLI